MGKIRSENTGIEKKLKKILWKTGLRYRKNNIKLYGKPDISNRSKKIVIFVDSCFWHGCPKHLRMPEENKKYWLNKIAKNQKRDKLVNGYYRKKKWKILRIWEHDIRNLKKIKDKVKLLA